MTIYLDTSALLRLIFEEKGASEVEKRVGKATRLVASRLVRVEAERALIRFGLTGQALERAIPRIRRSLEALWTRIDCLEITPEVCDLAGRVAPVSRLRTLDAIHLATFRVAQKLDPGLEMLSFDQRLLSEL